MRTLMTQALAFIGLALAALAGGSSMLMAQAPTDEAKPPHVAVTPPAAPSDTPESRMQRRFPQPVKVGDLIGLPVLDDDDVTLGRVREVVRSPEGKIKLIVSYSRWFGWNGRPVAVPIEVVAILAKQIAALDMPPEEFASAPTWVAGSDRPIPAGDMIRIAITRR
jgi:hypothetical protein